MKKTTLEFRVVFDEFKGKNRTILEIREEKDAEEKEKRHKILRYISRTYQPSTEFALSNKSTTIGVTIRDIQHFILKTTDDTKITVGAALIDASQRNVADAKTTLEQFREIKQFDLVSQFGSTYMNMQIPPEIIQEIRKKNT